MALCYGILWSDCYESPQLHRGSVQQCSDVCYCSCYPQCKHQLAARMARVMGQVPVTVVPDADVAEILLNA